MVKQKFRTPAIGKTSAWELAWRAVEEFERKPAKVEGIPLSWENKDEAERRRAQRLFYGFLRWRHAINEAVEPLLRRPPRLRLRALILLATYELWAASEASKPAVVHHAAGLAKTRLSIGEAGLVNAVLRRLAEAAAVKEPSPESAQPGWLLDRWREQFGLEATRALADWNQNELPIYACWEEPGAVPPDWQPTPWEGYFDVSGCPWSTLRPLLNERAAYIQDPFARHPTALLAPRPGEIILDGCAAPGGKSRGLLRAWTGGGRLVAADLPGPRFARLRDNLAVAPSGIDLTLLPADLITLTAAALQHAGCPERFDGILIDAPCSNTGVIARRPDVRHLLSPEQLSALQSTQLSILNNVAALVKGGGRLVYSTCSLEREENEGVVEAFLATHPEFVLTQTRLSRPWLDQHDGGAAFLLVRHPGDL